MNENPSKSDNFENFEVYEIVTAVLEMVTQAESELSNFEAVADFLRRKSNYYAQSEIRKAEVLAWLSDCYSAVGQGKFDSIDSLLKGFIAAPGRPDPENNHDIALLVEVAKSLQGNELGSRINK